MEKMDATGGNEQRWCLFSGTAGVLLRAVAVLYLTLLPGLVRGEEGIRHARSAERYVVRWLRDFCDQRYFVGDGQAVSAVDWDFIMECMERWKRGEAVRVELLDVLCMVSPPRDGRVMKKLRRILSLDRDLKNALYLVDFVRGGKKWGEPLKPLVEEGVGEKGKKAKELLEKDSQVEAALKRVQDIISTEVGGDALSARVVVYMLVRVAEDKGKGLRWLLGCVEGAPLSCVYRNALIRVVGLDNRIKVGERDLVRLIEKYSGRDDEVRALLLRTYALKGREMSRLDTLGSVWLRRENIPEKEMKKVFDDSKHSLSEQRREVVVINDIHRYNVLLQSKIFMRVKGLSLAERKKVLVGIILKRQIGYQQASDIGSRWFPEEMVLSLLDELRRCDEGQLGVIGAALTLAAERVRHSHRLYGRVKEKAIKGLLWGGRRSLVVVRMLGGMRDPDAFVKPMVDLLMREGDDTTWEHVLFAWERMGRKRVLEVLQRLERKEKNERHRKTVVTAIIRLREAKLFSQLSCGTHRQTL